MTIKDTITNLNSLDLNKKEARDVSSTFAGNLSLPVHRWFKFTAGYSAAWCKELIELEKKNGRTKVLDPFAGSGTTIVEAGFAGVKSIGIEAHPFIAKIAKAKQHWNADVDKFVNLATEVLNQAHENTGDLSNLKEYPSIIHKCYPIETLAKLDALKNSVERIDKKDSPYFDLIWLALASILRMSSPVGTAQWQYLLPNKTKRAKDPFVAFEEKIKLMSSDMTSLQMLYPKADLGKIFLEDARKCSSVPDGWADMIITSPPYANNYDYADAMRLEMMFFGDVSSWGDLQETVRKYLVRACTQHVARYSSTANEILESSVLEPISKEIKDICLKLEKEKDLHGGKKPYYAMVAYYFKDLAEVWIALRRATAIGGRACFVIGDSAPYGVYVPVDKWLGELALAAGFKSFKFEKTRDRNIKWKNRKHRVPLHEGRLWVEG